MLKVSIHAGSLKEATRFNLLAWLDIGYEKLAPVANYKTILFQDGIGATEPTPIYNYPRWTASLWDLVARAIALGLRIDQDCLTEEVPPVISTRKRSAFANQVCAVIEHAPLNGRGRRTLATAEIQQVGRQRGTYLARFQEDAMAEQTTAPFTFCPDKLRAAELLLHASLVKLTGAQTMPARPKMCIPPTTMKDGIEYVSVQQLPEPAKTGLLRWLRASDIVITPNGSYAGLLVPAHQYIQFLTEAV